jgi:2-dehydro-3-deoxy-D-gluconate 5-dehydrogenase
MRFKDDTILVTGASRGIGESIARGFATEGAKVIGVSRTVEKNPHFDAWPFDSGNASPADLAKFVTDIIAKYGKIDALVNNAGIIRRAPATEYSQQDWDDVIRVNLTSPFFLMQAVGKWWIETGRAKAPEDSRLKLVNIASLLSFQGGITVPAYAASKHGIAGVTKALSNEWAKERINVNAIAPGYIATENTKALREDPVRNKAILDRIPEGRWGAAEDIAGGCVFLASGDSDYLNGAVLNIDGGWMGR